MDNHSHDAAAARTDEPAAAFSRSMAEQLAFGAPFHATAQDERLAAELKAGTVHLAPHKKWAMPAEVSWRENPFQEPNWVAQYHMLRWLDPLRRRAAAGDLSSLDRWVEIAESWIRQNPPGRGRATYSWADMVEAARALTFAFALPVLADHRPEHVPLIVSSLQQHGDWLADPRHIRSGNHALQQHQGLLVIGAVLERQDWMATAVERAVQMLETSYDDQGINEEGAVQYHQINYMWWNNLAKRVRIATGNTPSAFQRVRRAPLAMAHATRPDGRYELIGDTEEFTPRALDHPAIEWVSSAGRTGIPPADRIAVYDAGYAFGRSTWGDSLTPFEEASFYSLRFGPQNRIHGHADGMALTLWAGGESLLVDSGKYAYDATDAYRKHLLSREAHNSLSVEGAVYDTGASVRLSAHCRHDGYERYRFTDDGYDGVILTRDVLIALDQRLAIVVDSFTADREVTVHQWWHLHPDAGHRVDGSSLLAKLPRNRLYFGWADGSARPRVTRGTTKPVQGWFSPSWRDIRPTRTIDVTAQGTDGRLVTALSFGVEDAPVDVERVVPDAAGGVIVHLGRGAGDAFTAAIREHDAMLMRGHHSAEDISKILD